MPVWYYPGMKLAEYLSENNIKRQDFARCVGVSEVAITRYSNGTRTPRPEMMRAIVDVTNGAVTPNDFLPPAPDEHTTGYPPEPQVVGAE